MGAAASNSVNASSNASAPRAPSSSPNPDRRSGLNNSTSPAISATTAVRLLPPVIDTNTSPREELTPDGGISDDPRPSANSVSVDGNLGQQPATAGHPQGSPTVAPHLVLNRPEPLANRICTYSAPGPSLTSVIPVSPIVGRGISATVPTENTMPVASSVLPCLNPSSEINARLDTQVEIKVYPCSNSSHSGGNARKKVTQFMVKPEGVIIQGSNRPPANDIGTEYSRHIGRKLPRYELSDTRASQLLITSHNKSFYIIPAPEAFSRHSGTCRLLGDRKHTPVNHSLKVGDFLRVGSVGVVVIETHNGENHQVMSEDRIHRIMQETTVGGYVDAEETDLEENSDVETAGAFIARNAGTSPSPSKEYEVPTCYMCFDDEDQVTNPLISPCKCKGDTQFVHVDCLRKWHTAETDNQICFLSTVDATCSVCKSTFKSDFRLKNGHLVKLFQSSLEPPYVSFLIATKHEMAQRLFNTRFQLSFKALLRSDGKNATRSLLLGRSSGSDMVLDYRTVSARHATIKFKNGDFIFADAGSSNGSYLYVRQPVELCANAPSVQFRLGRSMISVKVVNKWNRRLLRAVTRSRGNHPTPTTPSGLGSHENPHVNDGVYNTGEKKTRGSILKSMPPLGMLDQQSNLHLDLIFALAIPKRETASKPPAILTNDHQEEKVEESEMDNRLNLSLDDSMEAAVGYADDSGILHAEEDSFVQIVSDLDLNVSNDEDLVSTQAEVDDEDPTENESHPQADQGENSTSTIEVAELYSGDTVLDETMNPEPLQSS
eukprot:CAMPEP_0172430288 /NCGR_PEP_ID=MMETSP1064-20121228/53823_1 /TAXON_ID=202472 /ORGANISM="Aulacoseira subarctica , Strain CCAP 1002/5" /LENGTH=774 /DNA_ID=CAMNT_0013176239 /DNA_START=102 /DNA_END=2426 /DNA_ORIENTATION=-